MRLQNFEREGRQTRSVLWVMCSLVPRPVRAIRVTRGGLEQSAIANFPDKLDRWRHIRNRQGRLGTRLGAGHKSGFESRQVWSFSGFLFFATVAFLTAMISLAEEDSFANMPYKFVIPKTVTNFMLSIISSVITFSNMVSNLCILSSYRLRSWRALSFAP